MSFRGNTDFHAGNTRIAVIGSGISGLSAAWLLSQSKDVTLFEAEARAGGHSNTVDVDTITGKTPVDTGFIVYNDKNYPNLVALFDHLGVPTEASDMSFSASLDDGRFEYSGSGLSGLLSQRSNVISPRFWSMLNGILRFYREAPLALNRYDIATLSLGDFLDREGYSRTFVEDHLLPMGAAIWSTTASEMRAYPLEAFIRFFANHGLLLLKDRPQWRTVTGGSRAYVKRLLGAFSGTLRFGAPVVEIRRDDLGVTITCANGQSDRFAQVVIATHADQALDLIADPDAEEQNLLGSFGYTENTAVLHSDPGLMPKRRAAWASWNYIGEKRGAGKEQLCVTYWMNRLQNLKTDMPLFVTLNPSREIDARNIHRTFDYTHPLFDDKAMAAQASLWQLQGRRRTWFCGAYFGSGFHEDGLQSGLAVAEELGGIKRPWSLENPSDRIIGPEQRPELRIAAE
jgi:predicted NAD/FAD-binding protein